MVGDLITQGGRKLAALNSGIMNTEAAQSTTERPQIVMKLTQNGRKNSYMEFLVELPSGQRVYMSEKEFEKTLTDDTN